MKTFRPSSMSRIMICPGSYEISKKYPSKSGPAAQEGTKAHNVALSCLNNNSPVSEFTDDEDMRHFLPLYIDHIKNYNGGHLETRYEWQKDNWFLSGTPDFWHYNPDSCRLTVRDLKYGYGWAEPEENWQLLCYVILIMEKYPELTINNIDIGIVQPRANHPDGPIRTWIFEADLIRNYRNQIIYAIESALKDSPITKSGSHCRYCPGLLHCHSAQAAANFALDYANLLSTTDLPIDKAVKNLEIISAAIKSLESHKVALDEYCIAKAKAGEITPGYECSPSVSALKWDCDAISMGDMLGVDLRAPQQAITPTQAISRKILPSETVKQLASRKTGDFKLKKINLKRIKEIFNG